MKKEWSENEMKYKVESYCSLTERCVAEVEIKLGQWGATQQQIGNIIKYLLKEKYVDQERYCRAFVRDKYRFNQWGKIKIAQALRMKNIPDDVIALGMEEIEESEYLEILSKLLAQKRKIIKIGTEYERKGKLIRFAIGKGYEMEAILGCMKQSCVDDGYMD